MVLIRELTNEYEVKENLGRERYVVVSDFFKIIYEFSTGEIVIFANDEKFLETLKKLCGLERYLKNAIIVGFSHELETKTESGLELRKRPELRIRFIEAGEELWIGKGEDGCYFSGTINGIKELTEMLSQR
ncbi:hypothetical protein Py04_0425 [Pyrococcus sp. ST04]|nr:hypothetical protein Py04_0425 [Pyrococcus sp. ST04]